MEDTLRDTYEVLQTISIKSLNPCFNGRYSQRTDNEDDITSVLAVLILVLMEDTLRGLPVPATKLIP